MNQDSFKDYYGTLQASPNADKETIDSLYRLLAKRYHPDNGRTGDAERFHLITEAYKILSDPEKRASYDAGYDTIEAAKMKFRAETSSSMGSSGSNGFGGARKVRHSILSVLYDARRRDAVSPGVGILYLEQVLECARDQMEFHVWYLKEKGWIQRTETGAYAITAAGVDAVEENGHSGGDEQLLLER